MKSHKGILYIFFQLISLFGTPFFYIPVIAYSLYRDASLATMLIFIIISTEIICVIIKYLYPKDRPIPMPNKSLIQKYFAGSFPSVHTARITALFIPLISSNTNKVFFLIAPLLIGGVGYSRIYLKKHFLIDVLGGFAVGIFISVFSIFLI